MAGKTMVPITELRKPSGGLRLGSEKMSGFKCFNCEVVTGSCGAQKSNQG